MPTHLKRFKGQSEAKQAYHKDWQFFRTLTGEGWIMTKEFQF